MAETKWTEQQRRAIESRNNGLLVNAAAGSGKTAVLSRRVAALIEEGKSIERLLIVTFTRAAAAEMRQRIESALSERYEQTGDRRLLEQKLLADTAKICTIDSFFNSLLKENFQKADIPPDFSTLDTAEEEAITAECLEELIEEQYEAFPPEFRTAVSFFSGEGNDDALKTAVKNLYEFLSSLPDPEKWSQKQERQTADPLFWKNAACAYAEEVFGEIDSVYRKLLAPGQLPEKKLPLVEREAAFLKNTVLLAQKKDWDGLSAEVNHFSFERLSKVAEPTEEWITFKAYHNLLKEFLKKETNSFGEAFLISEKEIEAEAKETAKGVKALVLLTRQLAEKITAEYRKRNHYSFNEIARMAKNLLIEDFDPETGDYLPTPLGREIAESFDEILIDEYQDVNDLQDLLFRVIGKNGANLFVVGDVKQSIYGFRLSNPKNFIRKKKELHEIDLNRNFRSRPGILAFSNYIFSHLFNPTVTEIVYDESEKLISGLPGEKKPEEVEIHLLEQADTEKQAIFCAEKIKKMIAEGFRITDKETKEERPVTLSDFAILLRARKPTEIFMDVFAEKGIPLVSPEKPNFWKMPEVQTVLAMLRIINNPYDDSAVFSVIFSEMFAFTADEIALLRQGENAKETPLFEQIEEKSDCDAKCADFTRLLRHLGIMARNLPVYKLIWQILIRTEYLDKVSFLPMGESKRENLLSLYAFARAHPTADTLLKFLKLAELSSESARDSEKKEMTGQAVRIMTMHASKGLEFPVCLLPLLEKASVSDSDPVVISEKFGPGLRLRDEAMTYQVNTLQRKLIEAETRKKNAAEELRLLYVALTRPRDRLILVASPAQTLLKTLGEKGMLYTENERKSALALSRDNSLLSFLLPLIARHTCAGEIASDCGRPFVSDAVFSVFCQKEEDDSNDTAVQKSSEIPFRLTEKEIKERFAFTYPSPLTGIPAKVSVTELSKGFVPDPDSVLLIPQEGTRKPNFMQERKLSGAEKGTAIHTFLRFADFSKNYEAEITRLQTDDFLSEEQAESLSRSGLAAFFQGEVPQITARSKKTLREEGFVVRIPASFYPSAPKNITGEILMQGAIDLLCFTEGGLVLVDYKTDRLPEEKLLEKYQKQIELYCYAAEKMFGEKVSKAFLWSFASGKLIPVKERLES